MKRFTEPIYLNKKNRYEIKITFKGNHALLHGCFD